MGAGWGLVNGNDCWWVQDFFFRWWECFRIELPILWWVSFGSLWVSTIWSISCSFPNSFAQRFNYCFNVSEICSYISFFIPDLVISVFFLFLFVSLSRENQFDWSFKEPFLGFIDFVFLFPILLITALHYFLPPTYFEFILPPPPTKFLTQKLEWLLWDIPCFVIQAFNVVNSFPTLVISHKPWYVLD